MSRTAPRRRTLSIAGGLLLALALGGGCADSVDPTLGTDQAFTIWGALDPGADLQAIRVVPIQGQIDADPDEIDAEVRVTDLETGHAVAFRDSLVSFPVGARGHVYVADWTPAFDRRYRIEVRRTEDGATTTAEVRTPPVAAPEVAADEASGEYEVRVGGVPRVQFGQVVFHMSGLPEAPDDTVGVVVLERDRVEPIDGQWGRDLQFLDVARRFIREEGYPDRTLSLVEVTYRMYVTNAEWEVPEGGFDLDRIVEPGTISNVTDGFGYIGAGYWTEVSWVPSIAAQVRAGFFVAEDTAAQVLINEIGPEGWVELYNPTLETVALGGYGVSTVSGAPPADPFDIDTILGPGEFLVLDLDVSITPGSSVYFVNYEGTTVGALALDGDLLPSDDFGGLSYGSFPDGRSLPLRDENNPARDLLITELTPTPGEPNKLLFPYYVVNEVYAGSGDDGWVELIIPPGLFPPSRVAIASDVEGLRELTQTRPNMASFQDGMGVVPEQDGVELDPRGGELYVLAIQSGSGGRPPGYYIADYRAYGPQSPGTSAGLLPDGLEGEWTADLPPSRGRRNGSPRL